MQRRRVVSTLIVALILAATASALFVYDRFANRRFRAELDLGRKALAAGRPTAALLKLSGLAASRPEVGELQYLIGLCELRRGHPDRAERAWGKIAPGDMPYAGLAAVYLADLDRERGRLSAAEDRLRTSFGVPGSHRHRVRLALIQLLMLEGRLGEVRRLIADGLDEHPDPVEALKQLYKVDSDPFPIEAAHEYLSTAEKLAPDDDRLQLGKAHLAIRSGNYAQAESLLSTCLDRRPDDRAVWEMFLECGLRAERPDLVARAMKHLPVASGDEDRISELRMWAARLGRDRDAERRILEEQPISPRMLERLAELAIEEGRSDQAAAYRDKRTDYEQKLVQYLRALGMPNALTQPHELARMAKEAGRRIDERFWSSRIPGTAQATSSRANSSASSRTLADELPEVFAALSNTITTTGPVIAGRPIVPPHFSDIAEKSGLKFVHESGAIAGRLIPPVSASGGVGLLDFDRDGRLDVYIVQSGHFPAGPTSNQAGDRLFRNRGDGTFDDVTERAGLGGARGYGHGVVVGDVDNDGFPDLFVTRWRAYALYRNRGDGTFEDATGRWGLAGDRDWPTSAAFADLDGDGDLDLYVCHYLSWDEHDTRTCSDPAHPGQYRCNPSDFPALPDHVFRNDGGRFVDVTAEAGIVDRDGRGLGVLAADLDGDNRVDLFVANDMSANYLFINRGGFRFEERALEAGVAANSRGGYQAGMGVACGDLNGDGKLDLAVTNFYGESTSYFENLGQGLFTDRTAESGLQAPSRPLLGFGIAFLDANNDGVLDLLTANGHINDGRPVYPWKMPMQLLQGGPPGRLTDVSAGAGPAFQVPHLARGLATGDLDNDGRLDVLVQVQDEPLVALHNDSKGGHSIAFELEGTASNRDGIGALVTVVTSDGVRRVMPRLGGGSYQSSSSPVIHVGLGDATRVKSVEVRWPSGRLDHFEDLAADAAYRIREGSPQAQPRNPKG